MTEWSGMLWVLVPVTAIIGGFVYSIARLRWGADQDQRDDTAVGHGAVSQRELASTLAGIERRLDDIERALRQKD